MTKTTRSLLLLTASLLAARAFVQQKRLTDLGGSVVLITGGSRGLGLALAHEFGKHGCRLALCARDADELARAREELAAKGFEGECLVWRRNCRYC